MIEPGTKKGEILLGPFWSRTKAFFSIVSSPPIPEPIDTPILSTSWSSILIPESVIASAHAARPNWMKRSILRDSLLSIFGLFSKSLTVAPNLVENSEVSNLSINSAPLFPFITLSQAERTSFPLGHTVPRPVTTTRLPWAI